MDGLGGNTQYRGRFKLNPVVDMHIPRATPPDLARRGEIANKIKKGTETHTFYQGLHLNPQKGVRWTGIAWEGRLSPCCHQLGKTMRCFHDVSSSRRHCSAPGYEPPGHFS
jgi:hypothetical protein